jgi:D-alanyl-D-alanine carboxypeptidase (penicillin-binding protein 5/6)
MYRHLSAIIISLILTAITAEAALKKSKKAQASTCGPIQTSLIVDGKTGKILHEHNASEIIYPASLTKLMTLYLVFESLNSGKLTLDQRLPVSKYATEVIPLKLHLKPGEYITVRDAILGMIVKSANDASTVAAESISGSELNFARLMTQRARQLGMKNTTFTNAHGLHNPRQKTTAIDLAKLSIAIKRDFPEYYAYFAKTSFVFKGKTVNGHNRLTAMYPGAEGLKTGFTNPAGRNLITTATRGNKSLVGVVTGSPSNAFRDKKMTALLDQHFGVVPTKKANSKSIRVASNSKRTR